MADSVKKLREEMEALKQEVADLKARPPYYVLPYTPYIPCYPYYPQPVWPQPRIWFDVPTVTSGYLTTSGGVGVPNTTLTWASSTTGTD